MILILNAWIIINWAVLVADIVIWADMVAYNIKYTFPNYLRFL